MGKTVIAKNKKASFNFHIVETLEAGIELKGGEVKSLRLKLCNLSNSYVAFIKNEAFLQNMHISHYPQAHFTHHEPLRLKKLLLHRKEINRLMGLSDTKGMSCIPLEIYFNQKQKVKVKIAIAKGKNKGDKRQSLKKKQAEREMSQRKSRK